MSPLFILVGSCESTGTDTEKMIIDIVKMLVHSLAQYNSVPTSLFRNHSQAYIGN